MGLCSLGAVPFQLKGRRTDASQQHIEVCVCVYIYIYAIMHAHGKTFGLTLIVHLIFWDSGLIQR